MNTETGAPGQEAAMDPSVGCLPQADLSAEAPPRLRFEAVYGDHFAFVWRMTRRLGVPEASVDDVVQDVFLDAVRGVRPDRHRCFPDL